MLKQLFIFCKIHVTLKQVETCEGTAVGHGSEFLQIFVKWEESLWPQHVYLC